MAAHDDLMSAATTQTGLDDFGDDSFREGLEILVRSLREEARLNAAGEAFLYPRLVGHLVQRLQIEDWYRRRPEIDDVPIVAPLIGLGLPRTGSTALSFLLAEDPNVRYLRQWESSQPCPPPCTVEGPDPRIQQAAPETAGTKAHVPSDVNGPMECLDLMALDFKTQMYQRVREDPVVLGLATRRRPHLDVPVRASSAEAPAVGRADATLAAEDARRTFSSSTTSTAPFPTRGS